MTSYTIVRFTAGNVRRYYCLAFPFSAIITAEKEKETNYNEKYS